jgi:hypothetical protein
MKNANATKLAGDVFSAGLGLAACLLILSLPGCSTEQSEQAARVARSNQVTAWVAQGHRAQGHRIVRTDVMDDGSVVDWVDVATVPGANAAPPASLLSGKSVSTQAMPRELSGPPGALPFYRPAFLSYVDGSIPASSVDDYVAKISAERSAHGGPRLGNPKPANNRLYTPDVRPAAGNPNAANNRLYAPDVRSATNFGLMGFVNNFWTGISAPSSPDFSFYELAAYCFSGSNVSDLVGVIEGIDPQIYGNSTVFGAEFFKSGSQSWITGGGNVGIWHQFSRSVAPGAVIIGPSTIGGASTELQMAVILFNAASGATPGWWVWVGNQWIGYFDSTEFTALKTSACNSQWYGEAFDPDQATTDWMNATMGSGRLPNGSAFFNNFQSVGYLRQPTYYTAVNNSGATFWSTLGLTDGTDPNCYNVTLSTDGNASYNPTIFFGGPGGTSASCR